MGYPWRSSRYQDWGRLCGRLVALSRLKRNHRRDVVAIVRQAQLDVVAGRTAAENTWRPQSAFAALTHAFAIADAVLCQQLPGECAHRCGGCAADAVALARTSFGENGRESG